MKKYTLEDQLILPVNLEKAWAFISNPNNLDKIMPSHLGFKIISNLELPLKEGQMISYEVTPLPFFKTKWVSKITNIDYPNQFTDIQTEGPYKSWKHTHKLESTPEGCIMIDHIEYEVPFGILGQLIHPIIVKPQLDAIFEHRRKNIQIQLAKI